jgi:hypothetical protein
VVMEQADREASEQEAAASTNQENDVKKGPGRTGVAACYTAGTDASQRRPPAKDRQTLPPPGKARAPPQLSLPD